MQEPSSRASLTHASLLIVVSAGRVPTVTAEPGRPGETRLALDVAGLGHGVNVALVGPYEVLVAVVADLHDALLAAAG
jgi:hypothetical protein